MIDEATERVMTQILDELRQAKAGLDRLKRQLNVDDPAHDCRALLDGVGKCGVLVAVADERLRGFDAGGQIAALLARSDWVHPAFVLGKQRLPGKVLREIVRDRLQRAQGGRQKQLEGLLEKLEYSRDLAIGAEVRRSRRRR